MVRDQKVRGAPWVRSRVHPLRRRWAKASINPTTLAFGIFSAHETIKTNFVERHNLTQRQSNRRLTLRTNGFSKDLSWFERQLWLSLFYYHFVLRHRWRRQ